MSGTSVYPQYQGGHKLMGKIPEMHKALRMRKFYFVYFLCLFSPTEENFSTSNTLTYHITHLFGFQKVPDQ